MPTFKDSKDRTWDLSLNCDTVEQIKADCGSNVLDLLDPESELAKQVLTFPPVLGKLLFAALADQAKTKEVDEREFRRSMNGEALSTAHDLLLEEIVNFCPRHRRKLAAAVLEKNRDVQEAGTDLALTRLADPALKTQILAALETKLREDMQAAMDRMNLPAPRSPLPAPLATELSTAAGGQPVCSDSPDPDRTPGDNSAG